MPTPTRRAAANPVVAVAVLCFGGLTAALTQTMVIPIQTELPQLLHTSAANAAWVITITLLTAAISMPVAGRLADLFGKQRVLVGSAFILLVSSVICALSNSLAPMLVGRAMQGLALGLHPGRHLADPRDHAAAHGIDRHRVDERDARCRRRHRPAAGGLDRAVRELARPVLGRLRDGGARPGPGVVRRPARPRRSAGTARPRRDPGPRRRPRLVPGRHLEGHHVGLG